MLQARLSGSKRGLVLILALMLLVMSAPVAWAQDELVVACPEDTELLVEFEVQWTSAYEPVGGDLMGVTLTDTHYSTFTFESEVPISAVVVRATDDKGVTPQITTFRYGPTTTGPETVEVLNTLNVAFCVEEDDTDAGDDQQDSELPVTGGVPLGGLSPLPSVAAAALLGSGALTIRRRR